MERQQKQSAGNATPPRKNSPVQFRKTTSSSGADSHAAVEMATTVMGPEEDHLNQVQQRKRSISEVFEVKIGICLHHIYYFIVFEGAAKRFIMASALKKAAGSRKNSPFDHIESNSSPPTQRRFPGQQNQQRPIQVIKWNFLNNFLQLSAHELLPDLEESLTEESPAGSGKNIHAVEQARYSLKNNTSFHLMTVS